MTFLPGHVIWIDHSMAKLLSIQLTVLDEAGIAGLSHVSEDHTWVKLGAACCALRTHKIMETIVTLGLQSWTKQLQFATMGQKGMHALCPARCAKSLVGHCKKDAKGMSNTSKQPWEGCQTIILTGASLGRHPTWMSASDHLVNVLQLTWHQTGSTIGCPTMACIFSKFRSSNSSQRCCQNTPVLWDENEQENKHSLWAFLGTHKTTPAPVARQCFEAQLQRSWAPSGKAMQRA